jgi:hypothetical protein
MSSCFKTCHAQWELHGEVGSLSERETPSLSEEHHSLQRHDKATCGFALRCRTKEEPVVFVSLRCVCRLKGLESQAGNRTV